MTKTETEWKAWARERRAAFETVPLTELVEGERVQVGFSLSLYVTAPLEQPAGPQRMERVRTLWEELKAFAEAVAPRDRRTARVDVDQEARVVLRPANHFAPEVGLTFHLFPRGTALAAVTDQDRERMTQFKKRLIAFGVKQARTGK